MILKTRNGSVNDFTLKTLHFFLKSKITQATEAYAFTFSRAGVFNDKLYAFSVECSFEGNLFYFYAYSEISFEDCILRSADKLFSISKKFNKLIRSHNKSKEAHEELLAFLLELSSFKKFHFTGDSVILSTSEVNKILNIAAKNTPKKCIELLSDISFI